MGNLTAKVSGDIASFMSPSKTNIKSLKVHFNPKQLGEGDPSPENVREIVGWDGVEGYGSGKNLVNVSAETRTYASFDRNTNFTENNNIIIISGSSNGGYQVPCRPNTQYTYSCEPTLRSGDVYLRVWELEEKYNGKQYPSDSLLINKNVSTGSVVTFTTKANTHYLVVGFYIYATAAQTGLIISDFQLELGSIRTAYEPYQGTSITSNWSSDIGTVYGGYVDLISGELVQEYGRKVFVGDDDENINYYSTGTSAGMERHIFRTQCLDRIVKKNSGRTAFASNAIWISSNTASTNNIGFFIGTPTDQVIFYINSSLCEPTVESFSNWLSENNIDFVYKLETPITHQLTPTQLQSFVGQNNFWSNADYVEVEYDLIETVDIQKARQKIILNQPHLETVKDDLVNFNTDLRAPLKECKVYFEPIQEGSGDPSPDNVRNIVGWDEVEMFRASNTILPNDVPSRTINGITWTTNKDGSVHVEGSTINATWYGQTGNPMHYIKGNVTYKLSGGTENVALYLVGQDLDGTGWSEARIGGTDVGQGRIFTLDQDAYVRWQAVVPKNRTVNETIYPRLTVVGTSDEFEPYQGTTLTSDWSSDIGTVYGGYVDLAKGEVVAEWATIHAKDYSWSNYSHFRIFFISGSEKWRSAKSNDISDKLISSYGYGWGKAPNNSIISGTAGNMFIKHEGVSSTTEFMTWLTETDPIICYKLLEPIHYPLSSFTQQLLTLKRTNNIWSNANGQIETKYWKH